MNKFINYHFGSMKCFILSMIAIFICIAGLIVSFRIDEFVGSIILFVALLVISFALKD